MVKKLTGTSHLTAFSAAQGFVEVLRIYVEDKLFHVECFMRYQFFFYLVILCGFGLSSNSTLITQERLEKAVLLGRIFTKEDLTKQYKELDLAFNSKTERFEPTEKLRAKLESFGNDVDARFEFEDKYEEEHTKYFEMVRKDSGYVDYYQIYRVPNFRGRVIFSGSFHRFEGNDENILIGKESEALDDYVFLGTFQWQHANLKIPEEHLIQFYIKWIGVGRKYETGRGYGRPATKTLIDFVESNQLADLITVNARTPGSSKIFAGFHFTPTGTNEDGNFNVPLRPDTESYNFYKVISKKGEKVMSNILSQQLK
jgi:predicted GNAT family N-acyltransferase